MICKRCNTENVEGAKFCAGCGDRLEVVLDAEPEVVPVYKEVSSIIAIVVSVCCTGWIGMIFAILSLVEGGKVSGLVAEGRYSEAQEKLNEANKWNKIAWIINGVIGGLAILAVIAYVLMFLVIFGSALV